MFLVNELGFLVVHARLSIFCETEIESECVVLYWEREREERLGIMKKVKGVSGVGYFRQKRKAMNG